MNRGTGIVIGGLVLAIAIIAYILVTGFDAPAAVESGLQTVRDLVSTPAEPAEGEDTADVEAEGEAPATARAVAEPRQPSPVAATAEPVPVPPPSPAPTPETDPVPETPAGPPLSAPSGLPAMDRAAHFLPGNYPTWTAFGVRVTDPIVVRAGGVVSVEEVVSGPGGVNLPAPGAPPPTAGTSQLVMPSAPYLALLGRVCSDAVCSEPFLIGGNTTLCPDTLAVTGELQVLTNNYTRVAGRQTTSRYSTATGGFAFYTEPAAASACDGSAPAAPMRQDTAVLAAGEILRRPEFSISSGVTFWKPFFLPLGAPVVIRASGRIESTSGRPASGPEGVVVPEARRWWLPQERTTSLAQRQGRLYAEQFPYHALIGRLCGGAGCTEPFLVGNERVLCPATGHADRVELWINRVISAPGMLDAQTPVTYEMFDVQTQRGGYDFEVAAAPRGACGDRP